MSLTPLTLSSSGVATLCSIVSASAPRYSADTSTTGGVISGYCSIGMLRMAISPSTTIIMAMTIAKIGRLTNMFPIFSMLYG